MKFKTEKDIAKYYGIPYRTYLSRIRAGTLPKAKLIPGRGDWIAQAKKEYEDAKASPKYEIITNCLAKENLLSAIDYLDNLESPYSER